MGQYPWTSTQNEDSPTTAAPNVYQSVQPGSTAFVDGVQQAPAASRGLPELQSQQGRPQASGDGPSYSDQQRSLLMQYQGLVSQAHPQNPLFGNSQFALNHPRMAGAIGNAFLAASMIKPSQTIGEGISNVASGMLGVANYHRQQALDVASQPQQMLDAHNKSVMDLQTHMAQIANYNSEAQARVHTNAKADADAALANRKPGEPQPDAEAQKLDMWKTAAGVVDHDNMTQEEAQRVTKIAEDQKAAPAGSDWSQAYNMSISPDIATKHAGQTRLKALGDFSINKAAGSAGASTNATQNAGHAEVISQDLIASANKSMYEDIPEFPKNYFDWSKEQPVGAPDENSDYQKASTANKKMRSDKANDVQRYISSGASHNGTTYPDWVAGGRKTATPTWNPQTRHWEDQ